MLCQSESVGRSIPLEINGISLATGVIKEVYLDFKEAYFLSCLIFSSFVKYSSTK